MTDGQGGERFREGQVRDGESMSTSVTSASLLQNLAFSEFLPCPGCKNVPSLRDGYKCTKLRFYELFYLKRLLLGLQAGSMAKGSFCHTWRPKTESGKPRGWREDPELRVVMTAPGHPQSHPVEVIRVVDLRWQPPASVLKHKQLWGEAALFLAFSFLFLFFAFSRVFFNCNVTLFYFFKKRSSVFYFLLPLYLFNFAYVFFVLLEFSSFVHVHPPYFVNFFSFSLLHQLPHLLYSSFNLLPSFISFNC